MSRMNVQAKAALVTALCPLRFSMASRKQLARIVEIILDTPEESLSLLKDTLDYNGRYHNLHRIIFDYIEKKERKLLLSHITIQANLHRAKNPDLKRPLKVLSDIDDTWISSGACFPAGVDDVFPKKTPYPGVFAFYRELDLTTNSVLKPTLLSERSNLTFLSAKPHTPGGVTEDQSYKQFKQFKQFHTNPVLLAGDLGSFGVMFGAFEPIVEKKVQNFSEYISLYPDHNFVFIGDNGQGDYKVGIQMLETYKCVISIFIHRVIPFEETFGFDPRKKGHDQLIFFDTYIGASVDAFNQSLITKEGLVRVIQAAKEDFAFIKSTKTDTLGLKRGKSKALKEGTLKRQRAKETSPPRGNNISDLYESSQLSIQQLQELETELDVYTIAPPPLPNLDKPKITQQMIEQHDCGFHVTTTKMLKEALLADGTTTEDAIQLSSSFPGTEDFSPNTQRLKISAKSSPRREDWSLGDSGTFDKKKSGKGKTFQFEVAKAELNKDIVRANLYLDTPVALID